MIFLVRFGINKYLKIFSNTENSTRPTGSCNFVRLKFTRAYLFQIALDDVITYESHSHRIFMSASSSK